MFPHFHSRLLPIFGFKDVPIEWGIPGTGVHPMDDGLEQPVIVDGMMKPLSTSIGLGAIIDYAWVTQQQLTDELGVLNALPETAISTAPREH
jgi:hypothetical protein